jgi:hypothetical protein
MDEIVRAALAKWPNVPACRGWLGLDSRAQWYLRDDATQAAGGFPESRGSLIEHPGLREFIQRNYAADDDGAWFFQNGPQRVYVELEAAPLILRLTRVDGAQVSIETHCGSAVACKAVLSDELGRVFIATELGLGLVHSLDMDIVADQVENGVWQVEAVRQAELPQRFGFIRSPAAATG